MSQDAESLAEVTAWVDPNPSRPLPFWESLRLDAHAHISDERRAGSRLSLIVSKASVARSSGFHLMVIYRLAHTLAHHAGLMGRILAGLLFWVNRHLYGCSIASTARLHGGMILPHPQGIVIGPGVVVGPRAWVLQNVTLGGAPGKVGMPRVGADARIYCGAVLAGPIAVGDNVVVGANAVVSCDVPHRTLVRSPQVEFIPLPERFRVG